MEFKITIEEALEILKITEKEKMIEYTNEEIEEMFKKIENKIKAKNFKPVGYIGDIEE